MITLKDYIGGLYKEITHAKVQSDLETLLVAQEYAQNPLLKHFSVPNIRMKNIELNIPVAVDKLNIEPMRYSVEDIKQAYKKSFDNAVAHYKIEVDKTQKTKILSYCNAYSKKAADELQNVVKEEEQISIINRYGTAFFKDSYRVINPRKPAFMQYGIKQIPEHLPSLKSTSIEELPVIVETQALKEINDPKSIISIKMNVTDDAMEWVVDTDEKGNETQVLEYL